MDLMSMIDFVFPSLKTALNSGGLFMDIVGGFLIFIFGLPENINRDGAIGIVTGETDEDEKKKGRRYDFCARAGLCLLILGFALQLVSNYVSPSKVTGQLKTNEALQQQAVPKKP